MRKKHILSITKPEIHTLRLDQDILETVEYLEVPEDVSEEALKKDIDYGACQFAEIIPITEKKKSQYILIFADSREQGLMAVSYMAACFNQKNKDLFYDKNEKDGDGKISKWVENPFQIPIIQESQLNDTLGFGMDSFSFHNNMFLGEENRKRFVPFWYACCNESICIDTMSSPVFGMGNTDILCKGLKHFEENQKVYILIDKSVESNHILFDFCEEDEENQDTQYVDRAKWNWIILSYAADELEVRLDESKEKEYYKMVLKSAIEKKQLKVAKGFSYDKVVQLFLHMETKNKCETIDKIVDYAIKDMNRQEQITLKNSDFLFMDRFIHATNTGLSGKTKGENARFALKNKLIGMDKIKEQVEELIDVMKFNKIRNDRKISNGKYHNVHVMLGAPGTAKTTVAKLMGQIMVEEKLLPNDRFICMNGAELKGQYVGHSAPKTKEVFQNYDIIVIDEAYSLVGDDGHCDSFAKEAIAQLIIELENHSMDKLIIFAGYGGEKVSKQNNKMKAFLDANPGIKSRITSTMFFDSYSSKEMVDIFFQIAKNQNYIVDESVKPFIYDYFETRIRAEDFGNGREARVLLENSTIYAAKRIMKNQKKQYKKAELQEICAEDIKNAILRMQQSDAVRNINHTKNIGFYM